MRKNYLIMAVSLIAITVIAAVIFYINFFYVGHARSGDTLYVDHVAVFKELIQLDGGTAASGDAYKDFSYSIKDKDVYVEINYVLVSKAYQSGDFTIKMKGDFDQIKRVYLTDGKNKKLIWQADAEPEQTSVGAITSMPPVSTTAAALTPITPAKTALTLPADRIESGEIDDGMIGGTLRYQMTSDELTAFVNYFNGRNFTDDDKIKNPYDHDSLSDSTDLVLNTGNDQAIVIMGFQDGETMVSYPDGSGYSLRDPELTQYLNSTMGAILKEKGTWN
ncbi:MAG TPA: hypothetical protein VM577_11655 [Anaerovoracaceae bacterium]|nr:hypothetical protein [Anaerovoracaceae bacterium]